ncbi:MAG: hypothetical protein V1881_03715 [Candidatus Micrarchaeota archaeon]
MNSEEFGRRVICGKENPLPELTGKFPCDLRESVDAALRFKPSGRAECRKAVAKQALDFAGRAGLLTDARKAAAKELCGDGALVVEVAHQPTLFPYVGFFQKIMLGKAIAEAMRKKTKAPVVLVFGFLDTDFVQGKWFRKTFLPFSRGKNGELALEAPVSKKDRHKQACSVPAPSAETIGAWKEALATWLSSNESDSNKKGARVTRDENAAYERRLAEIGAIMDECSSAKTLAEFNAFFIAKVAERMGCEDMLFYEYSGTRAAFKDDYAFLLSRHADYAKASAKYYALVKAAGIEPGFDEADEALAAFWYDCECGAKNVLVAEKEPRLVAGKCGECEKPAKDIWERLSPRAISRPIVVARGLAPSVFVSGLGAFGFHLVARGVSSELGVALCPFVTWLPDVSEKGLAQRVKESKVVPSVLDAWINFGLEGTARAMERHLAEKKLCDALVLQ